MPIELKSTDQDFWPRFSALISHNRDNEEDISRVVQGIINQVKAEGDKAVIALSERFDRIVLTPESMKISANELEAAYHSAPREIIGALELAHERIRRFHERQKPQDFFFTDPAGVRLGMRFTALQAVGVYVPGGTAAYPSSVLMNVVPAKVAGVERIVMVVPAPDGILNPTVLAAAHIARVTEIYSIGGAQAVAALAYGTETIAPVDKIVGPGNAYVAAAKRLVFGQVGIDTIAGPSEILVVADANNDPSWLAIDLLSQAEHDVNAQSILLTTSADLAERVNKAVEDHLQTLPRATIARKSWEDNGAIILVSSLEEAIDLIDAIAPEHLEMAVDNPEHWASRVKNAGAIFLGRYTPEAVGDYVGGPNHVLPTSRSARFSSGLGVLDFMKRTTILGCDEEALQEIGPAAVLLGKAEGLEAHARSVAIRLQRTGIKDQTQT